MDTDNLQVKEDFIKTFDNELNELLIEKTLINLEWYYDVTGDMIYHQAHQIIIELMEKLNERDAK